MADAGDLRELQKCCERELGFRRHVYPRRIADGKMTQKKADTEIGLMTKCVEHFRFLADIEDDKGRFI